ncbi:VCBS repeat-containing protein OS=Streptomyces alboniger OX=132473 GN=CP975_32475 PE=4 SV=1 [Streptomyces alboniger]
MTKRSRALLRTTLPKGVLVSALALGVVTPYAQAAPAAAATAAVPAGIGPWTAPKELAGVTAVVDLKSARDGSVAGLFTRDGKTVLAVRPAGSTTWGEATSAPAATLQRTDDGAVSLLWWEDAADDGTRTLKMSRLAPEGGAFTPAETVTTGTLAGDWVHSRTQVTTLAANAGGHQAVAWMDAEHRLTVVERSGPGGAWSAPKTLDQLPDPIVREDNTYYYALYDMRVAVDPAGTVGVLWGGNSHYTGDGVDPDPSAYQWHYTYLEKPAEAGSAWTEPRGVPQLGERPGQVTLAAHPQGGFHFLAPGGYARKAAGATEWGPAEQTGIGAQSYTPADLHTAANGDVTAVGMGGSGAPAVATRLASRGSWGAAHKLASNVAAGSLGSVATGGGAVVVTYTQKRFELGATLRQDFVAQTVEGGDVAKPRTLNTQTKDTASTGRAAVDGKGRPVAVWTQSATDGSTHASYSATTGTRALPKWHDYADSTQGTSSVCRPATR